MVQNAASNWNYQKPRSGQPVPRPKYERGTSTIQVRSVYCCCTNLITNESAEFTLRCKGEREREISLYQLIQLYSILIIPQIIKNLQSSVSHPGLAGARESSCVIHVTQLSYRVYWKPFNLFNIYCGEMQSGDIHTAFTKTFSTFEGKTILIQFIPEKQNPFLSDKF